MLSAELHNMTVLGGPLPAVWSKMTRLEWLSLSLNASGPYGTLPVSWSSLSALRGLSIANANLTGGLPSSWSALKGLRELKLQGIAFTALASNSTALPASWSMLDSLETIVFDDVRGLTGPLPASWLTGFKNLTKLHLQAVPGLNVTSAAVAGLLNASRTSHGLQSLALSGLNMSGTVPTLSSR